MLIDSHVHLDCLDLTPYDNDLSLLIKETLASGVGMMMTIGTCLDSSAKALSLAKNYNEIYAAVGVHPSDVSADVDFSALQTLAENQRVLAIGETGLDYHYSPETKALQQESFAQHIALANKLNKPLVVHTRAAHQDTIALMRTENAAQCSGVMHCFTESWEMAKEALDLGFYISISGIVTFKKADNVREIAKRVPLDRLLIETDAPYLAPVPMRGKKNEPRYVRYVAEFLSDLLDRPYPDLLNQTANNFKRCFF